MPNKEWSRTEALFPEHPIPIIRSPWDSISRKPNPSLRYLWACLWARQIGLPSWRMGVFFGIYFWDSFVGPWPIGPSHGWGPVGPRPRWAHSFVGPHCAHSFVVPCLAWAFLGPFICWALFGSFQSMYDMFDPKKHFKEIKGHWFRTEGRLRPHPPSSRARLRRTSFQIFLIITHLTVFFLENHILIRCLTHSNYKPKALKLKFWNWSS